MKPASEAAYRLLHEGTLALSAIEHNGMRIDVRYLDSTIKKVSNEIKTLEAEIKRHSYYTIWKRAFGDRTKLGSRTQLGTVLFDRLKIAGGSGKLSGNKIRYQANEETLSQVKDPFVKDYLKIEKLKKVLSTSLLGIKREVTSDGYLHPSFNLNTVKSYRSSSDSPNFQNIPVRDPEAGKLVRRCIIPRKKSNVLVDLDYGQIEVRVAACYNHDPTLIKYITEKGDMHLDLAAQIYKLKPEDVDKKARYCAKNMFNFPQFYGSFYAQCAPNLWKAIKQYGFKVGDIPKKLGACDPAIPPKLGTFEKHIQEVEKDFWENRFKIYHRWKQTWFEKYLSRGWFRMLTGFLVQGMYNRKEVINYPIQGSAFHCLLWSLIRINKRLKKMKTKLIGQIHDSVVADVPEIEIHDYISLAKSIMEDEIRDKWEWIIVPLEVEAEVTEVGGSWHTKKGYDNT